MASLCDICKYTDAQFSVCSGCEDHSMFERSDKGEKLRKEFLDELAKSFEKILINSGVPHEFLHTKDE